LPLYSSHLALGVSNWPVIYFINYTPTSSLALFITAPSEYRVEQKIIRSEDSKAELSSGELMASTKGRLQPVAELGSELRQAVISVFKALWPRRAVPDDIGTLLQWIPLVSNRVDVWKESAA
jgi:hypothetical protein